jgi:hypothetical protein
VREGFFIGQLMSNAMQMIGQPVEDFYYESAKFFYWGKDSDGSWMEMTGKDVKLRLAQKGYDTEKAKGDLVSMADSMMLRIQQEHHVSYAGSMAGYECGYYQMKGFKALITAERDVVMPIGVEWPLIRKVIENQLVLTDGDNQTPHFYTWLKRADDALNWHGHGMGERNFAPGPMMVLAGPGGSGKSFLAFIVGELLGGRSGNPYDFMMKGTDFNEDLAKSELLVIDDEAAQFSLQERRAFGTKVKNMLFGYKQRLHPKGRAAMVFNPFWRLMLMVNDEPENLMILPPIDKSLDDKIMILKSELKPLGMPDESQEDRSALEEQIKSEIPAFLGWLRYGFVVPEGCSFRRTGVQAYKNPELMSIIQASSPEDKLLTVIDDALFADNDYEDWQGTANQLSKELCEGPFRHEAKALLNWTNAAGTYLGRLAARHPDRVVQVRGKCGRGWRIVAPEHRGGASRASEEGMTAQQMMDESIRRHREKMDRRDEGGEA